MQTERFRRLLFSLEDRLFDWRLGVETGGTIAADALQAGEFADAKAHATAFQSVWCRNLRVLIGQARRLNGNLETFVDIGAGKGKACFYAAPSFERVIGVEFSRQLMTVANDNLRRTRLRNIEFVCADAAAYDLPEAPALVFLFNPFEAPVFERFLARNQHRMRSHGSVLAYANDIQRALLPPRGFECLFSDDYRRISLWR
jgi:SAM-dependent methyltransferase